MSSRKKDWQSFLNLCQQAESTEKLDELMQLMFTIEEREQLIGRLIITRELLKGDRTQREIAADFDISIAKITRGSNGLKTIHRNLRKFLNDHLVS